VDKPEMNVTRQEVLTSNMQEFLTLLLQTDGQSFLINVSVEVSSFELIKLCRERLASFTSTLALNLRRGGRTQTLDLKWHSALTMRYEKLLLRCVAQTHKIPLL